jgi:16S rRNA (adenine1518-N6/adenine1519-N6)-dimethyltransferase
MRAKKRFGQHFLEAAWADKVVAAIDPRPSDRFVEIGPGPGALTLRLAPRVAQLLAIEIDSEMVAELRPRLPSNAALAQADFLTFDMSGVPMERPFRLAGNLPYNVSSPILFALIAAHRAHGGMLDATLMLQREVAERLYAAPGSRDYGVLSILVQLYADVRPLLALPPGAFRPRPKVHSSVVSLRFRPATIAVRNEAAFESMVRTMFMQRRKTLLNAMRTYAASRGRDSGAALAAAGVDPMRRPETLQLTELARLAEFFDPL